MYNKVKLTKVYKYIKEFRYKNLKKKEADCHPSRYLIIILFVIYNGLNLKHQSMYFNGK